MRTLVLVLTLIFGSVSFAGANIVGEMVDGGKTLSIKIIDDPSANVAVAGLIWESLVGSDSGRCLHSPNLYIICDGSRELNGVAYGTCLLRISASILRPLDSYIGFELNNQDALPIIAGFENLTSSDLLVQSGDAAGFTFKVSLLNEEVSLLISKSVVAE